MTSTKDFIPALLMQLYGSPPQLWWQISSACEGCVPGGWFLIAVFSASGCRQNREPYGCKTVKVFNFKKEEKRYFTFEK